MTTPLCDLCVKYGTDKVIWGYTPHYFERLNPIRFAVKQVLEIGICGQRDIPNNVTGASLWVWHDFFPNAEIIGIDNEQKWMVNEGRIRSYCLDAYNQRDLDELMGTIGQCDFIVDDAVHDPVPQAQLLNDLWPHLAADGLYAMEDVCPYKLPDNNLDYLTALFPENVRTTVISTHKAERLLLVNR